MIDRQIRLDSLRGTPIRLTGPHVVFWWTRPTNPGRSKLSHKGIGVNTPTSGNIDSLNLKIWLKDDDDDDNNDNEP